MGAEQGCAPEESNLPITDLNDERVQKQNQNAIENYKRYIENVKDIRKETSLDKGVPLVKQQAQHLEETKAA